MSESVLNFGCGCVCVTLKVDDVRVDADFIFKAPAEQALLGSADGGAAVASLQQCLATAEADLSWANKLASESGSSQPICTLEREPANSRELLCTARDGSDSPGARLAMVEGDCQG